MGGLYDTATLHARLPPVRVAGHYVFLDGAARRNVCDPPAAHAPDGERRIARSVRVARLVAATRRAQNAVTRCNLSMTYSATGTRTRVARVRAEYPNQLDYSGSEK